MHWDFPDQPSIVLELPSEDDPQFQAGRSRRQGGDKDGPWLAQTIAQASAGAAGNPHTLDASDENA